jgi:hypothetical protein
MVWRMRDLDRAIVSTLLALATIVRGTAVRAQEHVALGTDVLLYGDNTEFRNPFREGETIFGAAARVTANLELNPRTTVTLGVFGNQRFGSDKAFEQVRPVIALSITGARSMFVFGAFPAWRASAPQGPDRGGPHGLLPALQRETLTFDRPFEPGLLWTYKSDRIRHESWLEWQQINTAEHRERFDAGVNAQVRAGTVSLPFQLHVVHQGGQLFASGPVADSVAAAAGLLVERALRGSSSWTLEGYGAISRYVPDRAAPERSRDGTAFFGRAAIQGGGWRAHLIVWRGRNFIKQEGDPNYLSLRRDGTRYRGTRDYSEIGASRRFELARSASLEVSGRFHRIEHYYEYSYRVTSTINFSTRIH